MRIYADTSFLVSFLYPGDVRHVASRRVFASHAGDGWLTSEWSQFETVNALRQLCLAGLDAARAEAFVRLFKHWHRVGPFEAVDSSFNEAMNECRQLSAASASRLRMRSADVIHVALLEQLNPDLFVTRDRDQYALAMSRAFPALLV